MKNTNQRNTSDDQPMIDLVAGLLSCLGSLESPTTFVGDESISQIDAKMGVNRSWLTMSADDANELALRLARAQFGGDRYRVITLLGSQHGETHLLRSASGRPESQSFDGPVAAGFRHVRPGDIAALTKMIDASSAAICLSPVDWNAGGVPFETEYLAAVAALCHQRDLLLMIDETRIPPGISGHWFLHQRSDLTPDLVTASAGWTAGLPGGIVGCGPRVAERAGELDRSNATNSMAGHLQLLRQRVLSTAQAIERQNILSQVNQTADIWAAMLDELVAGFDFVRAYVQVGLWTTIHFDLPASDVVAEAKKFGINVLATDETTILLCPPTNVTGDELLELIGPLRGTLESLELQTTLN